MFKVGTPKHILVSLVYPSLFTYLPGVIGRLCLK